MRLPSQITIDTSSIPAAIRAVETAVDANLATWALGETQKVMIADLNVLAPALGMQVKRDALERLMGVYRAYGWNVDYDLAQTTPTQRVFVFRLPT